MVEKTAIATEVNRLYWGTEESVAEISNRLGVSRRALYELIEPSAASAECPSCGAELYFNNRSAKSGGIAHCLICGTERELAGDSTADDAGTVPPYSAGLPSSSPHTFDALRDRTVAIAGFAIAGVVAGAIVTLLIKRKR